MRYPFYVAAALLALGGASAAEEEPVVYAPDIVGTGRLFMVALRVPQGTPEVEVLMPEGITLLDRTHPPYTGEVRRFYFRAAAPSPKAEIRFRLPGGEITVAVEVWSFDDLLRFRTLKETQLPRRWPLGRELPELKSGQVFPTGAEAKTPDGKASGGWLDVSDEAIWQMQPDSTIPRWHWVNLPLGCPVHGTEIYRKAPYYPWGMNATLPWDWKITCPTGGEQYPSNDFAAGDMTSGPFPDDGIGGGYVKDGQHYGFIAELSQFYCRRMMQVAPECASLYASTGDRRYAHKALVALCRLAVEYAYLATMTQHRHRNTVAQVERFGQGRFDEGPSLVASGFTTYPIEQPGQQAAHAEAYDSIFPVIDQDPEIIGFLQSKGFAVKTHEDVRRFIEENLLAIWMQGSMDGSCASNEPMSQWGFARMAEAWDLRSGADFMDFLYYGQAYEFTPMGIFVPNTFFLDGSPFESTGGYNSAHLDALWPIVETIERMRARHPDIYPENRFPPLSGSRRYRRIFDFAMDTVTIDRAFPQVGDGGGWPNFRELPRITWHDADAGSLEHAYKTFRDPKFAWALARNPSWQPSSGFPWTRVEIEAEAAKWPDDWNDNSSLHDGYGIAILRGGKGDGKRAFWLYYGHNRGHSQDDLLDFGLQGYGGVFLEHMGYPRNWGYWEYSWSSHYGAKLLPDRPMTSSVQFLADAGLVQAVEAHAEAFSNRISDGGGIDPDPDRWQRRLLALVDAGDGRFYGVDFYRLHGGTEHWWPFHAQEGEFTTRGIDLTRQEGGTLAGPNVPYGDAEWMKANGCTWGTYGWRGLLFPLAHLYNVERGAAPTGAWHADWKLKESDDMHLRLTLLGGAGMEVSASDGTSPAGGKPYEMKWIMLHKTGEEPVKTQILNILEPYRGSAFIQEARALQVSGPDESGFAASGCLIRLENRQDILVASADPKVRRKVEGGLEFAGRFGFWSEQEGVPVAFSLAGGTHLSRGKVSLTLDRAESRTRITKVDRVAETITVSPALPSPESLTGEYLFITNPARRIAVRVLSARSVRGGTELLLDADSRIGTGRVTGAGDFRVETDTPFPLQGWRYYHGARLVNASSSAEYRLLEVRDNRAAILDPQAHPEARADRLTHEFPAGSWFEVYDWGVDDEVVWVHQASVTRTGPDTYTLSASTRATLRLPAGYRQVRVPYAKPLPREGVALPAPK